MRADIVQRLRDWAATICMVRGMGSDVPSSKSRMALEAADEIERTRAERDEARRERDEARREVCALDADTVEDQREYAAQRGWDCFDTDTKENT